MWKKDEATPTPQPTPRQTEATPRPEAPRRTHATSASERAVIGRSISINGDVTGDEDLLIQGQVEGSVNLDLHAVTVGSDGRVKANITGRVITVEGEVEGDLQAQEQITLRSSARVTGDITAPRVVLDDGASFRGLVDMGDPRKAARGPAAKETKETKEGNGSSAKTSAGPRSSGGSASSGTSQESSSAASA